MIVEGCDILLDVNQVFVRQGKLNDELHKNIFDSFNNLQAVLYNYQPINQK